MANHSYHQATHSTFKCSSTERFRLKRHLRKEVSSITVAGEVEAEAEAEVTGLEEEAAEAIPSPLVEVAGDVEDTGEVAQVDQTSHIINGPRVPPLKEAMMLSLILEPKMITE